MSYKRPESVLIVIYDTSGRVLVLQREDDPHFWQSVTGTIESGELPVETAQREVKEETGINPLDAEYQLIDCRQANQFEIRSRWQHRYPPGTRYNTEYVFSLQVKGDEAIHLTEHLQHEWLSRRDALERVWSETNRLAIEKFVPIKPGK